MSKQQSSLSRKRKAAAEMPSNEPIKQQKCQQVDSLEQLFEQDEQESNNNNNRNITLASSSESFISKSTVGQNYVIKRQRNNVAVKKTRERKRQEEQAANDRINQLKTENNELERKIEVMKGELDLLKALFATLSSYPDAKKGNTAAC